MNRLKGDVIIVVVVVLMAFVVNYGQIRMICVDKSVLKTSELRKSKRNVSG